MDQKLQNLFLSLPSRSAWIILGSCAAYWVLCLTGLLTPPVSAPPNLALYWFYAMLMLALASGVAAVALGGLLVMRRRGTVVTAADASAAARLQPGMPEGEDQDQLAGLGRMLDDPDNVQASANAAARVQDSAPKPRAKQRKRRR
ncbi:hypothetical protein QMA10_17125 [Arthrobacter sp. APC 3897]|uniref:hypothetical protein n=1 Tax=Arthrobacter sp. APC 3897 TaxID=3035204 RepID=UPI0025B4893B|nr:hypothetical protein [Arthrobacter sp. APC 3897]MDN3483634.1 hypothetical protein [Arthrobacter sp. APC 3897]